MSDDWGNSFFEQLDRINKMTETPPTGITDSQWAKMSQEERYYWYMRDEGMNDQAATMATRDALANRKAEEPAVGSREMTVLAAKQYDAMRKAEQPPSCADWRYDTEESEPIRLTRPRVHSVPVQIVQREPNCFPVRQTEGSAGYDLRSPRSVYLEHNTPRMVDLGVDMWIRDPGLVGMFYIRSSLAKQGVLLLNGAGVIDSDYQGPLMAILQYIGPKAGFQIDADQRVGQLVLTKVAHPVMHAVHEFRQHTDRGTGGFGSTGEY